MATYVWRCQDCRQVHEREYGMHEDRPQYLDCGRCGGRMIRQYGNAGIIMRPDGWNLRPEDPGYSFFDRERELGQLREGVIQSHYSPVPEPEPERVKVDLPYEAMKEIHLMGEVMDRAIKEEATIPDVPETFGHDWGQG